jgi:hypothetical protein
MARGKINRGLDSRKAQQVISTAVDAAQTLIKGVADVAERAIAETAPSRRGRAHRTLGHPGTDAQGCDRRRRSSTEGGRQGAWATASALTCSREGRSLRPRRHHRGQFDGPGRAGYREHRKYR